jgi:polysaccharide pyruvyl transferase WcaK-like protein
MRLHAAVFAFCCHTPTLMLAYHEKSNEWSRMVGLSRDMVLDSALVDEKQLVNKVSAMSVGLCPVASLSVNEAICASMRNWSWINQ